MTDLTILMPSYNKEEYIAQAIDSVFSQQTTYSYHIIVADDHSTDKTLDIVKSYQMNYPEKITLLTSDKNLKLYRNILRAYAITKSPFFCVLDPDDYWINPNHIQNALDFFGKHPNYTIYSTGIMLQTPDNCTTKCDFAKRAKTSSFSDFLRQKAAIAYTQTTIYRNVIFGQDLPRKMQELETPSQERSFRGDSFRNILHLHEGLAYYNPSYDAVYRITNQGIWTSLSLAEQHLLNCQLFKDLWLYFDKQYPALLFRSYTLFQNFKQSFWDCTPKNATIQDKLVTQGTELNTLFNTYKNDVEQGKKYCMNNLEKFIHKRARKLLKKYGL